MLKNKKIVYFCQECGYESAKWMGQCPGCKAWNSFVEEPVSTVKKSAAGGKASIRQQSEPVILKDISLKEDERQTTKIGELDRVLGGGIVPGSLVLVGGDPGIGKSTLLLQVCRNLTENGSSVLYISGEESLRQIKLRANRIGTFNENLQLLCETNLDKVREVMERKKPDVAIIDSIQTMFDEEIGSAPGSVSQVRESTNVLMQIAKGLGITIFIVGHVTKEGNVAGPRVLEHMVDTVLYFEGDRHAAYRILRGVKNRFGSTNEIGVFENFQEELFETGHVIVTTEVVEKSLNYFGNAHGGYLFTLCDQVAGLVALSTGDYAVTLQSNINYLKAGHLSDQLKIEGLCVELLVLFSLSA